MYLHYVFVYTVRYRYKNSFYFILTGHTFWICKSQIYLIFTDWFFPSQSICIQDNAQHQRKLEQSSLLSVIKHRPWRLYWKAMCLWNHLLCNATLLNKNDTLISFYELIPFLTIHMSNAVITSEQPKQSVQ